MLPNLEIPLQNNRNNLTYCHSASFYSGIFGPLFFATPPPDSSEVYAWAVFYVSQGISVIPLKERDKTPCIPSWKEYQKRLPTPEELLKWYPAGAKRNIGLVTGMLSGINVVDFDSHEAHEAMSGELPLAPVVRTSKGFHIFCKAEAGATNFQARNNLKNVDFRAEGGYVVAPPSIHPSGVQYQWEGESYILTLPKLPAWVLGAPEKEKAHDTKLMVGVEEGGRNNALASLAGRWFSEGKGLDEVLTLASEWNCENHPPMDDDEVERTVRSIFKRHEAEKGPLVAKSPAKITGGPLPLRRPLLPPPEFPVDALPTVIRDAVDLVIDCLQVPPALAGQCALAASALATQGLANVGIDGRVYPISEDLLSIADTGERKSASDRLFLTPHRDFQLGLATLAASQRTGFKIEHTAWKVRRDAFMKKHKAAASFDMPLYLKDVGKEPAPPREPLFLVEEPTYEGLIKLLENGRPSVGLFSDEGGRFLGGHGMNKDNVLKTIAGLSKLWDGDPITRSRSGEGNIILFNRRCSMHLMIQPQVMPYLFGQGLLAGQGFLSRVLCAYPSSTISTRPYREKDIHLQPAFIAYTETLTGILKTHLNVSPDDPAMGLTLPTITLTSEAKQDWIKYHDRVESGLKDEHSFSTIKGFGAKAAEHALRLAAVFSLVEDQKCTTVKQINMTRAIKLMDYYLMEALRLFGQGHDSPDLELAEKCLAWCQTQEDGVFELARLYQRGPNAVRDKSKALHIISILCDHGWLQKIEGGLSVKRQHHRDAWCVINHPPC